MVARIATHNERMSDVKAMNERLTPDFAKRRGAHLAKLHPLEDAIRRASPFPASYDVARAQPPYFSEFTYTELMGCFYACPQSSEIAARVVERASEAPAGAFDAASAILSACADKYSLEEPAGPLAKRVAFLPGTNVFEAMTSREALARAVNTHSDLILKPHPMTLEPTLRHLGMLAGYHRVAAPMSSGWAYLMAAEEVWVTSCTEMGLYACLLGKKVHNIGNVRLECHGSFAPFYRLIWDKTPEQARKDLIRALNAEASGFVHPDDPQAEAKLDAMVKLSLELREPFKPLTFEYDANEYAIMTRGNQNAVRPGGPQERRDPPVAASGRPAL